MSRREIYENNQLVSVEETALTEAEATKAVQRHLDSTAQSRGYDDIKSAVGYVGDPNPTFDAEGVAFRAWRSAVWAKCFELLAAQQAGTFNPIEADEVIAQLPAFGGA
jgi:hypothetical protein